MGTTSERSLKVGEHKFLTQDSKKTELKKKYQVHVLLIEITNDDGIDFLYEEEVVLCKDEYATLEEAIVDFNKVARVPVVKR